MLTVINSNKGVCDKWFIWNPSNCKCECNKSNDFSKCLDYENCKRRKKLVDKLVDECNETINEVKIVRESKNKCSSCILHIVLFSIFFTINVGIGAYFVYYKYENPNKENIYHVENYWYKMGVVKQIDIKLIILTMT